MPSVILLREHFMFLTFSEFQGSESRLSQDQPDFSMCIFAVRAFKHTVYMEYIHSSFFVQFALPNNINSETLHKHSFCHLQIISSSSALYIGLTSYSQKQTCIYMYSNMNSTCFELVLFLGVNAYCIQNCWSGKC